MAHDDDSKALMGLFSTRAGQSKVSERPSGALDPDRQGADLSRPGAQRPTPSANSGGGHSPISSRPSGVGASQRLSGNSGARTSTAGSSSLSGASGTYGGLSPLGSTVLREARRELGSSYNLKDDGSGADVEESAIVDAVDKVLRRRDEQIDDIEKANIVIHLQKDLLGWGVLQPLIENREVTDIHCYNYKTVVLQRGKMSEITGLHWPNKQAYRSFIDRLLLRLGKSLSTQQHTIDAAFPNGIRICAVHESVCGTGGPLLSIRVPRVVDANLESLLSFQMAPPLIIEYLASLTSCGECTMILAGETGTGKTTLLRCLATQFGQNESIVSVEDTPELNLTHPFYRALVSRPANVEGVGEVTLQEHIKTTLRMTPTRVILGEMRTPPSAEAFLEAAQTGHTGMSTVHARNARETLVRLESLLGRAQKAVAIDIIRQQIALAVDVVIWLFREKGTGKPRIGEVIEVGHFVEGAIQVKPMFSIIKMGQQPVWRVESWSSHFDHVLARDNIFLGDSPPEITLSTVVGSSRKPENK